MPKEATYRKIAARTLGRPLRAGEVVHHKDGNHWNDLPSNLEVMSNGAHSRMHALQSKAAGYHQNFMIDKALADPVDVLWSQLVKIDLSDIVA